MDLSPAPSKRAAGTRASKHRDPFGASFLSSPGTPILFPKIPSLDAAGLNFPG